MAEEKKVYVEEEQAGSFTLKNYFRGIKRFKWWVIGSTVACAVLGFVGFKFVLNPSMAKLTASFKFDLAGKTEDDENYRLIDGSVFNYYDIVSKENLQKAKDADKEKFSKIDVDDLYSNGAISVEKVVTQYVTNSEDNIGVKFTVKASLGSFPNVEVGSDYLYTLINLPKDISSAAISNYSMNCYILDTRAEEAFDKQITALSKQYNKVSSVYYELQNKFGGNANSGVNSKSLVELLDDFSNRYDMGAITSIKLAESSLTANKFVNYVEGKEAEKISELHALCKSYIDALRTYESDEKIYSKSLEDLSQAQNINMSNTEYSARCLELEQKVTSCKQQIEKLKIQLDLYGYEKSGDEWVFNASKDSAIKNLTDKDPTWVASNNAFKTTLEGLATSLLEDRETATKAYKNAYSVYSNKVTILDSGYVSLEKHISSILSAPVGALLGFLVSSIVTTFVYAYKVKKED